MHFSQPSISSDICSRIGHSKIYRDIFEENRLDLPQRMKGWIIQPSSFTSFCETKPLWISNEKRMLENNEESVFPNAAKITKNLNLRQICVKI